MREEREMMEKPSTAVEDMEACRGSEEFDDDGKPKRTGTLWTASAHIITAVIGSGVLSLGWAMAQLGWVFGPIALLLFSMVTFCTASLLADCYRTSDPVSGKRNYNYMSAVKSNLDANQYWFCGLCQYINLFGTAVGYTITASISAIAITQANCYHSEGHDAACNVQKKYYMIGFGIVQIFISQLPNFHKLWWLSIVAAIMSFAYSFIAVGLSLAKVISGDTIGRTSATGLEIGMDVTAADKVWNSFQALGNVAFAYSYALILIEIEDTLKSPPAETKVMRKATFIGVSTTTIFYFLCGCLGYTAFGNKAPGNMLTDFGFYEPFWLVDLANVCIIVHLVGAFQVYTQPLFAAFEALVAKKYPEVKLLTREIPIVNARRLKFDLNFFRLVWRTAFVAVVTVLAITFPFFNNVLGFLGAVGFWPLTVYFPIEMYMRQRKVRRFSVRWMLLRGLSAVCFCVTLVAIVGSVQCMMHSLKGYRPFHE